ncbi:MAG: hypothetical protein ABWY93_08700 [Mycobacterium sp.]
MSGDQLKNHPDVWRAIANATPPPPPITPDTPITGASLSEGWGGLINMAAASDDPKDQAEAEKGHAERTAAAGQAAEAFPANEEKTAAEMKGVDQASQMAQQLPQMASSIGGALAGAVGGIMQPLTQIPQQLAQTGQQLLQQGMGAMGKGGEELKPEDLAGADFGDELGGGDPGLGEGGGGSGGGGGGMGSTTPTAMLGPPAAPSASTSPMSARAMPPVPPAPAPAAPGSMGGMGGMPMMPHGGMGGGAEGKDDKAGTKRVSVPSVKNGAPVQGRITTPPSAPTVTKRVDGKPVASKRIVIPNERVDDQRDSGNDRER